MLRSNDKNNITVAGHNLVKSPEWTGMVSHKERDSSGLRGDSAI
jgi:hypothetical protein